MPTNKRKMNRKRWEQPEIIALTTGLVLNLQKQLSSPNQPLHKNTVAHVRHMFPIERKRLNGGVGRMASLRIHAKKRKASSPLPIAVALGQRKRLFANVESYLGLWFAKAVGGGFTFFDAKNEEPNRTNDRYEVNEDPFSTLTDVVHAANAYC